MPAQDATRGVAIRASGPSDAVTAWRQETPFGDIVVELGDHGVTRVTLPRENSVAAERRVRRSTTTKWRGEAVARELDEYFAGTRTSFDVAVDLDATPLSDFQRHVLLTVRAEVPHGETATYGEVAELAGRPGAARAVGTAMARNPVPFLVPCHRVVAANGIGGYGGGPDGVALKRALLDREARARPSG